MPLPLRNTIFCLLSLFGILSCKPQELLVSSLDVPSFSLQGFPKAVFTPINETVISISVPYGTNLKDLKLNFKLLGEGTVIPASGVSQDFSKPVYFTTVHPSGGKKIYEIRIVSADQPAPTLVGFSKDSLLAGDSFIVSGQYFGKFGLDVSVAMVTNGLENKAIGYRLIDSTRIEVSIPDTLKPNFYNVLVGIKDKKVTSSKQVRIKYPKPILQSLNRVNVLPQDTISLKGRFLDAKNNTFIVKLQKGADVVQLQQVIVGNENNFKVVLAKDLSAGSYAVSVLNKSQQTNSSVLASELVVFDPQKPYVTQIIGTKTSYAAAESLGFKTINFEKAGARFYQVALKGSTESYFTNGIETKNQLSIELPAGIKKGVYELSFTLTNPTTGYSYSFSIDQKLTIQ